MARFALRATKRRFLARFGNYAPLNDLYGAIRPLRATIPLIGAIPARAVVGGKKSSQLSHLDSIAERVFFE
jgi:hypothetical protein